MLFFLSTDSPPTRTTQASSVFFGNQECSFLKPLASTPGNKTLPIGEEFDWYIYSCACQFVLYVVGNKHDNIKTVVPHTWCIHASVLEFKIYLLAKLYLKLCVKKKKKKLHEYKIDLCYRLLRNTQIHACAYLPVNAGGRNAIMIFLRPCYLLAPLQGCYIDKLRVRIAIDVFVCCIHCEYEMETWPISTRVYV